MPSACSEATGAMPAAWAGGAVCPDTSEYICVQILVSVSVCRYQWVQLCTDTDSVSGYQWCVPILVSVSVDTGTVAYRYWLGVQILVMCPDTGKCHCVQIPVSTVVYMYILVSVCLDTSEYSCVQILVSVSVSEYQWVLLCTCIYMCWWMSVSAIVCSCVQILVSVSVSGY